MPFQLVWGRKLTAKLNALLHLCANWWWQLQCSAHILAPARVQIQDQQVDKTAAIAMPTFSPTTMCGCGLRFGAAVSVRSSRNNTLDLMRLFAVLGTWTMRCCPTDAVFTMPPAMPRCTTSDEPWTQYVFYSFRLFIIIDWCCYCFVCLALKQCIFKKASNATCIIEWGITPQSQSRDHKTRRKDLEVVWLALWGLETKGI